MNAMYTLKLNVIFSNNANEIIDKIQNPMYNKSIRLYQIFR